MVQPGLFSVMLQDAVVRGYAVPAFNVYNLESMTAALKAGAATGAPIILALGERYFDNMPPAVARALADALLEARGPSNLPVALHLDHAADPASCRKAIKAGFDSVMIDASQRPLAENIRIVRDVVAEAHVHGVAVEAELGGLAVGEASHEFSSGTEALTDPDEARTFVVHTGVDALAVSVGTVHGMYKGEPHIDFDRLAAIRRVVEIPLVLHGGSGIPKPHLEAAMARGVAKINVNTEISLVAVQRLRDELSSHPKVHLAALALATVDAMESTMTDYIDRFNASKRYAVS